MPPMPRSSVGLYRFFNTRPSMRVPHPPPLHRRPSHWLRLPAPHVYQELAGAPACAHYTNVRHAAATPQHSSPMGTLVLPLARVFTACEMHSGLPKQDNVMLYS